MKFIVRGAAVAATIMATLGYANAACVATSQQAAKVLAVKGSVLVSGKKGFTPLVAGETIGKGAEIILGRKAAATVAFGEKRLILKSNSTYRLGQSGGSYCLARAGKAGGLEVVPTQAQGAAGGGASAAGAGGLASSAALPVLVGAGALVAIGVTVAIASKDHSVSN